MLDRIKDSAPASSHVSDYWFNAGDVALAKKDYQAAVNAFKSALLANPSDLEAKENYIYAKKKLEDQQKNGAVAGRMTRTKTRIRTRTIRTTKISRMISKMIRISKISRIIKIRTKDRIRIIVRIRIITRDRTRTASPVSNL